MISLNMSSSIILTKQLDKDSYELKKYLSDFLDEKVKGFSDTLKDKIGHFVNGRMLSFYNCPSHDSLFDEDGDTILKGVEGTFKQRNWTHLLQEYRAELSQKNRRCFHIQTPDSSYFFFEQCIVVTGTQYVYPCSDDLRQRFSVFPHTLHPDVLRTIKHFQLSPGHLEQGLGMYRAHPEFFHSNSTEFEEVCAKEYHVIYEKKKKLDRILEERGTLEEERRKLAEERKKLTEEKKQWILVKQKITRMHLDLAKERTLFEKFRREEVDLDEFLEEVD